MDTEESNRNLLQTQDVEDTQPLFPGKNAMSKISDRIDRRAFQSPNIQGELSTPSGILRSICREYIRCAALNPSGPMTTGIPACNSGQPSPAQEASDPRKTLDFADGAGEEAAAGALDAKQQGTRYIKLPHMRLVVVHEKYWLAILHKDKLVEFRSSKQPISLEAGQCILFAVAMRHRRNGKDALVFARVWKVELLDVDHARENFPRESDDCNLAGLAAKWGVTTVRCIVLFKDSIRIADEIANLSKGCEGIVHQFALKTGVPHFCHVSDLGKTVSFTLQNGNRVHCIFRLPLSSFPDCDSRGRSTEEMACTGDASTEIAEGTDQRKAPSTRKRGHGSDGVVPELLELIGTLSTEQQMAMMGIISRTAGQSRQKKRSRPPQPNQLAESRDSPCQSKQAGSSTVLAVKTKKVGVEDVQVKDDAGMLAPHLHRDTSGTYRTAFHFSSDVRQKTVAWILANCSSAYSRPVISMWNSGTQPWTIGLPVPPPTTLANWLRDQRKSDAAAVGKKVLSKQELSVGLALSHRVKQEKLGASLAQLTPFQIQMKALQVSMSSVLQCILASPDSEQWVFNILLVSKHMHAAVTKTSVFSHFIANVVSSADIRRMLREFELSRRLDGPAVSAVYESSRKIPVLFPNCNQDRVKALTAVFGQDVLDSLSNLGDGMPFIEQFAFLGKGSYGSVWSVSDTLSTKAAWKVMHQLVPLWAVPKTACNEFTMNVLSQLVSRQGKATRHSMLPFAIGPIDTPEHPMQGKQCFGLPSKEKQGMFYPVLVKRQAHGTLLSEVRELSKLFNDRSGKAPPEALARAACMMECALEAVNQMHMYAGTHRDIKADNFLLEDCRPDSQGKFMRTHTNRKVKVYVGDLGLSIPHGVQTYSGKQRTFAGTTQKATKGRGARQLEKDVGVCLGQDNTEAIQKANAATEAKLRQPSALATALKVQGGKKDAPVLMEVQVRALHLLTGAFPSHAQSDDPPPPPQYASGWGTHLYSPPEKTPKLPPGIDFADSRSYRAGDMWAMGTMLTEMVKGDCLKVAYHPDDSHGKELFATYNDNVFWRNHLNKLGDEIPDEWQPCMELIRNLCAFRPEDRMTASNALEHEFLRAARSDSKLRR